MKKNFLAISAVVTAIVLCSFTSRPFTSDVYMVYNGGTENAFASYSQQASKPASVMNIAPLTIVWAKFVDNDGIVTAAEFPAEFEVVDIANDGANLLSDETEDGITIELK